MDPGAGTDQFKWRELDVDEERELQKKMAKKIMEEYHDKLVKDQQKRDRLKRG